MAKRRRIQHDVFGGYCGIGVMWEGDMRRMKVLSFGRLTLILCFVAVFASVGASNWIRG